jgi:hypothetical protein
MNKGEEMCLKFSSFRVLEFLSLFSFLNQPLLAVADFGWVNVADGTFATEHTAASEFLIHFADDHDVSALACDLVNDLDNVLRGKPGNSWLEPNSKDIFHGVASRYFVHHDRK